MKNNIKKSTKGIRAFNTIYFFGIAFAILKIWEYLVWTFQLVKAQGLPDEPFFSKVNLANSHVELSVTAYLVFAIAYIVAWGFVILGLMQLNKATQLIANHKLFQTETSLSFKKAGKLFLAFAYSTFIIDVALLIWARTSNRIIDLLSVELMLFLVTGYFMFFLSDVFQEGALIAEENELTI